MIKLKYKIGYGTYEESEYTELEHEHYFPEELLTEMITKYIEELIPGVHDYQGAHEHVIKRLIEKDGFKRVEYDVEWSVFGWGSLFETRNFNDIEDKNLSTIKKYLKEEGYNKFSDPLYEPETKTIIKRLAYKTWQKWEYGRVIF